MLGNVRNEGLLTPRIGAVSNNISRMSVCPPGDRDNYRIEGYCPKGTGRSDDGRCVC